MGHASGSAWWKPGHSHQHRAFQPSDFQLALPMLFQFHFGCLAKFSFYCLLIPLLAAGTGNAFGQKRNITVKDLFDFVWIGGPQDSPERMRVGFVRISANEEREGYNCSV